jgi:hypothetical protein
MNKQQELEMWYALHQKLRGVPKEHRTINHSHYQSEIENRIYSLVDELGFDQKDWKVEE